MNGVIGDLLPLAVGIAISPVPVIAVILMLLAPRAGGASLGYLLGWVVGIVVAVSVVTVIVGGVAQSDTDDGPSTTTAIVILLLGVGVLVLAVRQWRGRPKPGGTGSCRRGWAPSTR